mmetsp:Transcript_44830/g.126913  ORF Transcript_44830/g.126913 Transcript_44830/m.126913 type:complete len:214 (-) Transcript_44830:771-1412(-)
MHALTAVQKHVGDLQCSPKSRLTLGGCSWRQYNRVRAGCSVFALAWKCEHAVCQTAQEWHMERWRHRRNADPCAARLHKLCHAGRCVFQSSQLGNLEPLTDVAHGHGILGGSTLGGQPMEVWPDVVVSLSTLHLRSRTVAPPPAARCDSGSPRPGAPPASRPSAPEPKVGAEAASPLPRERAGGGRSQAGRSGPKPTTFGRSRPRMGPPATRR